MTELEARKFADLEAIRAPTLGGRLARWRTALANAWHELRKSRTASIGAVMLVLLFGACIATPWIATHDPIKQSYRARLAPPSEQHLLGTDRLGRDIYSRLLYGGGGVGVSAVGAGQTPSLGGGAVAGLAGL